MIPKLVTSFLSSSFESLEKYESDVSKIPVSSSTKHIKMAASDLRTTVFQNTTRWLLMVVKMSCKLRRNFSVIFEKQMLL